MEGDALGMFKSFVYTEIQGSQLTLDDVLEGLRGVQRGASPEWSWVGNAHSIDATAGTDAVINCEYASPDWVAVPIDTLIAAFEALVVEGKVLREL